MLHTSTRRIVAVSRSRHHHVRHTRGLEIRNYVVCMLSLPRAWGMLADFIPKTTRLMKRKPACTKNHIGAPDISSYIMKSQVAVNWHLKLCRSQDVVGSQRWRHCRLPHGRLPQQQLQLSRSGSAPLGHSSTRQAQRAKGHPQPLLCPEGRKMAGLPACTDTMYPHWQRLFRQHLRRMRCVTAPQHWTAN